MSNAELGLSQVNIYMYVMQLLNKCDILHNIGSDDTWKPIPYSLKPARTVGQSGLT